jgi:hypothetical protein
LPEQAAQSDDLVFFFDIAIWVDFMVPIFLSGFDIAACDDFMLSILPTDFEVVLLPLQGLGAVAAWAGSVATSPTMATAEPSASDAFVMRFGAD